MYIVQILNNIH